VIFRDVILCLGMFWLTTQISQHLEDVDLRGRGGEEVGAGRGGGHPCRPCSSVRYHDV